MSYVCVRIGTNVGQSFFAMMFFKERASILTATHSAPAVGQRIMAQKRWVTVEAKHCELVGLDVELREQRLYPTVDFLNSVGNECRVRVCICSAAVRCNMTGISCQWAMNSPGNDRF